MKKNKYVYVILLMIAIIILMIINIFKYDSTELDEGISNKVWYRYNYNNGLYETLKITKSKIDYFKPTGTNNTNSLDNCTKFNYDKKNKILKLNCNKEIKILSFDSNSLTLEFDDKNQKFFLSIEDSLNYEFETYFEKSIIDYKKERNQVTDFSKINQNKLFEVIANDDYSKIVFIGNKCTSVDCVLILDIMEKWVSTNENIYYFDVNNINNNVINYFNRISDKKYNYDDFDTVYPVVFLTKNNKVVDHYELKCSGFNCTKYYKNEF